MRCKRRAAASPFSAWPWRETQRGHPSPFELFFNPNHLTGAPAAPPHRSRWVVLAAVHAQEPLGELVHGRRRRR